MLKGMHGFNFSYKVIVNALLLHLVFFEHLHGHINLRSVDSVPHALIHDTERAVSELGPDFQFLCPTAMIERLLKIL